MFEILTFTPPPINKVILKIWDEYKVYEARIIVNSFKRTAFLLSIHRKI